MRGAPIDKPLAEYSCVPCKGGIPTLTPEEIAPLLLRLNHGWMVEDDADVPKLVRRYKLKDFVLAVDFVNQIRSVAEAEGHHPDLYVSWGKVIVYVWTHAISGLTESDFYLAAKIECAFEAMRGPVTAQPAPARG